MLWDSRILEKLDSMVGSFFVSCLWRGIDDGFVWVGRGLYDPNSDILRQDL